MFIIPLIIVLTFAMPLALGGMTAWAVLGYELSAALLIILWAADAVRRRAFEIRYSPLFIPAAAGCILAALALVPLPPGIHAVLSPYSWAAYRAARETLASPAAWTPLALDPAGALSELLRLSSYAVVFFMVFQRADTLARARRILLSIVVLGFAAGLFSIIYKFAGNDALYWIYRCPGGHFGPYINYDHYGGFINICIMISLGFLLTEQNPDKKIMVGFMSLIMIASLLLSQSRGALMSFIGGGALLACLLIALRSSYDENMLRHVLWALGIVLTLTVLFIVWVDGNAVWGRLKTIRVEGNFFHPRIEIWRDALPMARVFALSGAGLGGFAAGFPAWQTSHLSQFWRHAHNDYLQILIENGIPGLICALAALFLFFRIVARKIRESRSDQLAGLLAGCAAAALTMITHSAVDFNLRITANAHLFAVVLALGAVVSDFKRNEYAGVILRLRLTGRGIIFLVLAAAGLSAALAVPSFAFFRARWLQSTAEKTQVLEIRELFLRRASAILPAAGGIRADLGRTLMRRSAGPGLLSAERSWFLSQAGRELRAAITLSPCLPEAWSDYGWYLANTGRPADGRIAMGRAAALAPRQPMIANSSRRYRDLFPDSDSKGARNRDLQVAPGRSRRASQLQ